MAQLLGETRENERFRAALLEIIQRDRLHGVDPKTKSERQVWFDGPCAEIARAALADDRGNQALEPSS